MPEDHDPIRAAYRRRKRDESTALGLTDDPATHLTGQEVAQMLQDAWSLLIEANDKLNLALRALPDTEERRAIHQFGQQLYAIGTRLGGTPVKCRAVRAIEAISARAASQDTSF